MVLRGYSSVPDNIHGYFKKKDSKKLKPYENMSKIFS